MMRNLDYPKIKELAKAALSIPVSELPALASLMPDLPAHTSMDTQKELVHFPALVSHLQERQLLLEFIPAEKSEYLPSNLFAFLYAVSHKTDEIKSLRNLKAIHEAFQLNANASNYIYQRVLFAADYLQLQELQPGWTEFCQGFTAKNWPEIHLLGALLPLSSATADEGIGWMSLVMRVHEKDGALGHIGKYITDWITQNPALAGEIEQKLPTIAKDEHLRKIYSAFLFALKKVQGKPVTYYQQIIEPLIEPGNDYFLLYALGMIGRESEADTDTFYALLLSKLEKRLLSLRDFISLCTYLKIYRTELFSKIKEIIVETEDIPLIQAVIDLLFLDTGKQIGPVWRKDITKILMTKASDELKQPLDMLLMDFVETDLDSAYELFEFRIQLMAFMHLLEDSLVEMVRKDVSKFHRKLVEWFTGEDGHVHYALRYICSIHALDKSIFRIPAAAFEGKSEKDKVYMAHKIAGYIYSKDQLQELMLSLIKSIDTGDELLYRSIHHLMTEYVIYNYRTTLEMMQDELDHNNALTDFAKKMFQQLIEEFNNYFEQFRTITAKKELTPSKDHMLLKSFHTRKRFAMVPKAASRNSLMSLFKNTQVNSNRWAVRQPGQPKHVVQELAHISITTEFPSGENLDPIQQEYARKVYQKMKKDEINID